MELAKLVASFLTPLTIALVGYFVQRTLAEQNRSWKIQDRLADKRAEIYEKIAADLNKIYCYVMDVGAFRDETPASILIAKRNMDKQMYMFQAIWPEDTFKAFTDYMHSAFATYQGVGEDAKIRAKPLEKRVARENRGEEWPTNWNDRFTGERDPKHKEKYDSVIKSISRDLMHWTGNSPTERRS
jgi:hypothetical protein